MLLALEESCWSPLPLDLSLGFDPPRAPTPEWEWEETPVLLPQLLGLNLDPGILRCEHSQLVVEGGGPGN